MADLELAAFLFLEELLTYHNTHTREFEVFFSLTDISNGYQVSRMKGVEESTADQ